MKSKLIQTLNWTNLENISEPLTPIQIKTMGAVLTKNGAGSVICPKCNVLNLVRDNRLQCHCGFTANMVDCTCKCGGQLLDKSIRGKHVESGDKHRSWKGGRKQQNGYWFILMPNHHLANKNGYVEEHRLIYEDYYDCCLLPGAVIHHYDGNGLNNKISNLILTSKREHRSKYHRKDYGQICERCSSISVRRYGHTMEGSQRFICNNCGLQWTSNRTVDIDYGQICRKCNSTHVTRAGIYAKKKKIQMRKM